LKASGLRDSPASREEPGTASSEEEEEEHEDWKPLALQAGLCAAFGLAAFAVSEASLGPAWLAPAFYLAAMAAGGYDAAKDASHDVLKGKFDIHFLMLSVAAGAAAIGELPEGALLLFLFSASHAIELFAEDRTQKGIHSMLKESPKTARVVRGGEVVEVPVEKVREEDEIVLLPGSQVPVDAEILSGSTTVDESSLTGESLPISKDPGDMLSSGSMNLSGAVHARAIRRAGESTLQKLTRLIQDAQHLKAPSQRFTDRFGTPYTLFILGSTLLTFFWLWQSGMPAFTAIHGGVSAFNRAVTLLVVASPCALALSIPSAILAAIARGAMRRILFRGGAPVERMAAADLVAMDKTGTLTTGRMSVERVEVLKGEAGSEESLLAAAAALERRSTHPVAEAVERHAREAGVPESDPEGFSEIPGRGVLGRVEGEWTVVGRESLLRDQGADEEALRAAEPPSGAIALWVMRGAQVGRIILRDTIRPESREVVARLQAMGKRVVMLTGDRKEVAEKVARAVGVDEFRFGLSPEEKFKAVEAWKAQGHKVVMVGDGINDAAALAAADVSAAMGGDRRTDAALENGDVVLMRGSLESLLTAFEISAYARRIIAANLAVALGVILTMVASALMGHESSTVLVCLLSLLLLTLPLTEDGARGAGKKVPA
jgi:Cd2+/Zn2+-exporting ATPase